MIAQQWQYIAEPMGFISYVECCNVVSRDHPTWDIISIMRDSDFITVIRREPVE